MTEPAVSDLMRELTEVRKSLKSLEEVREMRSDIQSLLKDHHTMREILIGDHGDNGINQRVKEIRAAIWPMGRTHPSVFEQAGREREKLAARVGEVEKDTQVARRLLWIGWLIFASILVPIALKVFAP